MHELKGAYRVMASNIHVDLLIISLKTELETAVLQVEFKNCPKEKELVEKVLSMQPVLHGNK